MREDRNERWRWLADRLQARWEARLAEQQKAGRAPIPDGGGSRGTERRRKALDSLAQIEMMCAGMAPGVVTDAAERVLQKAEAARVAQARTEEHELLGSVIIPPPDACECASTDDRVADPQVLRDFPLDDPKPDSPPG